MTQFSGGMKFIEAKGTSRTWPRPWNFKAKPPMGGDHSDFSAYRAGILIENPIIIGGGFIKFVNNLGVGNGIGL
jgi:hypothetical protein